MAANNATIKRRLAERLAELRPVSIDEAVWKNLLLTLAPVSERYLRELLHGAGIPFAAPYAGVRQHSFDELEESLLRMGEAHAEAVTAGDRERARYCRRLVIQARNRANAVAAGRSTDPETKVRKREMADWMLVWLEDPAVFPVWVEIRKRAMRAPGPTA